MSEPHEPEGAKQDRLLDRNDDGIQEYDHPLPAWRTWILWATIALSVLFVLNVPGIGIGHGRFASDGAEMAKARARHLAAPAPAATHGDAARIAMAKDPSHLALGRTTFETTCASCHRMDGGGNIGPNLTDDAWLHGGRPNEILATVRNGVIDRGMPAWGAVLPPDQIPAVVNYVLALHVTRPAKPKPPPGRMIEAG